MSCAIATSAVLLECFFVALVIVIDEDEDDLAIGKSVKSIPM